MMNNGTRYAGISTSGNTAIGPVVTSPAAARAECRPPVPTATTKSKIPNKFQATKTRLVAKPGRRTRARATQGAVTPIARSPKPAGQAKTPGSTPCTYRARNPSPPARHACIAAPKGRSLDRTYARKAGQTRYAARNTTSGAVAPRRIGKGGVPGGLTNAPAAPSRKTAPNQRASTPTTIALTVAPDDRESGSTATGESQPRRASLAGRAILASQGSTLRARGYREALLARRSSQSRKTPSAR